MLRFNLYTLLGQLEDQLGRRISIREVGRSTGIHYSNLSRIARNDTGRVDLATLDRLLAFFRAQGLQVDLCDLLVEGEADQSAQGD